MRRALAAGLMLLGLSACSSDSKEAARDCRGSDLAVRAVDSGSVMSQPWQIYTISNKSKSACTLSDYPAEVMGTSAETGTVHVTFKHDTYIPGPKPGEVKPGADGYIVIQTATACDEYLTSTGPIFLDVQLQVAGGGVVTLTEPIDARCGVSISRFGGQKAEDWPSS